MAAERIGRDDGALQHLVRVFFDYQPVLEGSGFALIGVDAEIDGLPGVFRNKTPLNSRGKTCSSPSTQTRFLDDFSDLSRLERQGLAQSLISTDRLVDVDAGEIRNMHIPCQDFDRHRPFPRKRKHDTTKTQRREETLKAVSWLS
jgi:hypothetical protein